MEDFFYKLVGMFLFYGIVLGAACVGLIWFLVWLFS